MAFQVEARRRRAGRACRRGRPRGGRARPRPVDDAGSVGSEQDVARVEVAVTQRVTVGEPLEHSPRPLGEVPRNAIGSQRVRGRLAHRSQRSGCGRREEPCVHACGRRRDRQHPVRAVADEREPVGSVHAVHHDPGTPVEFHDLVHARDRRSSGRRRAHRLGLSFRLRSSAGHEEAQRTSVVPRVHVRSASTTHELTSRDHADTIYRVSQRCQSASSDAPDPLDVSGRL